MRALEALGMGGDYTGLPLPFTPRCELPLDPTQSLMGAAGLVDFHVCEENRKFRGWPKKEKNEQPYPYLSPGIRKKLAGESPGASAP